MVLRGWENPLSFVIRMRTDKKRIDIYVERRNHWAPVSNALRRNVQAGSGNATRF